MRFRPIVPLAAACIVGGVSIAAHAQSSSVAPPAPTAPAAPAAPAAPVSWIDSIKFSGHIEGGITGNFDSPNNNTNFGQLFTDRDNSIRMNQALVTAERDLDPNATGFDFGFKLQALYGTDARITHFFNEFDRVTNSPYQWDIVEANVQAHIPVPEINGIDVKLGQYSTPLGYEVIDATGNPLYTHSYIFNYGLPFKHTGILTTTHIADQLDFWLGVDTGVNDSIGDKGMNNQSLPKLLTGFGLNNLLNGKLTILALTHIGAENPYGSLNTYGQPFDVNSQLREYYDMVVTYKISDALTSVTELNRVHDDYYHATAGGIAQYLTYTVNDQWSVTGRAEAFADQGGTNGFAGFVCVVQGPLDYVDAERGLTSPPNTGYCGSSKPYNATYGELTLGATYKPPFTYGPLNLSIRPEIRYDQVIGGTNIKPFNVNAKGAGTDSGEFTASVDFILAF